eukprot:IDg16379t1
MRPGLHQLYAVTQIKPYKGKYEEAEETMGKISQSFGPWLREYHERKNAEVYVTEVIKKGDPRATSPEMRAAISKEIQGLINRGVFKIVLKQEISEDSNLMGGRFVLAIKDVGTDTERYKARFIILGHRDKDKTSLVHACPNLRQ